MRLPTIPRDPKSPIPTRKSNKSDILWNEVEKKLDQRFNGFFEVRKSEQAKQTRQIERIEKDESNQRVGCINILVLFTLLSIIFGTFRTISFDNQEFKPGINPSSNHRITDYSFELSLKDNFRQPGRTSFITPNTSTKPNTTPPKASTQEEIINSPDEFQEKSISNSINKKDNNRYTGRNYLLKIEPYGRYESCQGLDENGFKPCKIKRSWFIVNESRNIHHLITIPTRTHKDIYAIRPFRNSIAEVYYYDGTKIYLKFCLDLNDNMLECRVLP